MNEKQIRDKLRNEMNGLMWDSMPMMEGGPMLPPFPPWKIGIGLEARKERIMELVDKLGKCLRGEFVPMERLD